MAVIVADPGPNSFVPINMFAMLRNMIANNIPLLTISAAPTNGTSGTFAGLCGPGATIVDIVNAIEYFNIGTLLSPIWTPMSGASVFLTATLTLTSAQIKAIRATPITLIAAPGAGLINRLISLQAYMNYPGTNVFTNPQNISAKYKDGTTTALNTLTAAGFLDQAASELQNVPMTAGVNISKANSDNQPIVLHNVGASEITGNAANDNTIVVKVAYAIDTVAWT